MKDHVNGARSGYQIYNAKAQRKTKTNTLDRLYPPFPIRKFSILYADPPWHSWGLETSHLNVIASKEDDPASDQSELLANAGLLQRRIEPSVHAGKSTRPGDA